MTPGPKKPTDKYFLVSPFWILQLWLNATFSYNLKIELPKAQEVAFSEKNIEGRRLATMKPKDQDLSKGCFGEIHVVVLQVKQVYY